ncbi:MAG TPA: signal peptidase I [Actinomycetota bacterium]|nr:signal peptidase I [Actinomycetota bacterium]
MAERTAPARLAASAGRGVLGFLRELPGLLLMAFVLAFLIKSFLVQAFYIPSASMEPTLMPGDRVLVNKVPYYLHDPVRGDVIVFRIPDEERPDRGLVERLVHWLTDGLGLTRPAEEDFVKRVIGLPGDVVQARRGRVYVNGRPLEEPYLTGPTRRFDRTRVPAGMLFVLGDNRGSSNDSRFGLGFIPIRDVIGRAFVVIWPPSRAGLIR